MYVHPRNFKFLRKIAHQSFKISLRTSQISSLRSPTNVPHSLTHSTIITVALGQVMRFLTFIICVFTLAPAAHGFRSALALRSRYSHLSATKNFPGDGKERNWFQQMVQSFIEAFPEVLRPPKEMDPTKVIYDPASFDTVILKF